ncbi:MAG: type II toxin-antitoxin system RelE/ParE family toxin [Candidatus Cloacimonadota bacterium]|nr:type II toxin-antitoxin system RelE/ParE family toxin [Candidatus Cloacimonadota bacterium]
MNFSFHPEAEEEFYKAIDYYEMCENGLGYDFSIEIYCTIQSIIEYPNAWSILEDNIHRCLTNRFPYGILYSIETNEILILAVMNLHRGPNYWKERIP